MRSPDPRPIGDPKESSSLSYRPNVAAILQNDSGQILLGERCDFPGSWQFPQGGLHRGETLETGLQREVREEISLAPTDYTILGQRGPYRYRFPDGVTKKGFQGQEQHYFLLRLTASEAAVDVGTAKPEFRRVRWIEPAGFQLAWLPAMKYEVYRQVFRDFFAVHIG